MTLPIEPGEDEFLIIPDLREDERTKNLFYVKGPPCWRFYWGTPLITKSGISIGALCILDDKVRTSVTLEQKAFCRTMASVMMEHLETLREAAERKKGMRMSQGLNAFVEGRSTMDADPDTKSQRETLLHSYHSLGTGNVSHTATDTELLSTDTEFHDQPHMERSGPSLESVNSAHSSDSKSTISGHNTADDTTPKAETITDEGSPHQPVRSMEADRAKVFQRAAGLLRQSLDLQEHGGVVFFDTSVGFSTYDQDLTELPASPDVSIANTLQKPSSPQEHDRFSSRVNSTYEISRGQGRHDRAAEVLSLSHEYSSEMDHSHMSSSNPCNPVSEHVIQQLLRLHPKGHLWSFDELAGNLSSDSDSPNPLRDKPAKPGEPKRGSKTSEAAQLQQAFVGGIPSPFPLHQHLLTSLVRQLLFIPQWDAQAGSYSSCCFCWTTSEQQVFSAEAELSFLAAFSNCIMAEISRIASVHANQQKSDFISSISHELRSPLHGKRPLILPCMGWKVLIQ